MLERSVNARVAGAGSVSGDSSGGIVVKVG